MSQALFGQFDMLTVRSGGQRKTTRWQKTLFSNRPHVSQQAPKNNKEENNWMQRYTTSFEHSLFALRSVWHGVSFALIQVSGPQDIDVTDSCTGTKNVTVEAEKTYSFTVSCFLSASRYLKDLGCLRYLLSFWPLCSSSFLLLTYHCLYFTSSNAL